MKRFFLNKFLLFALISILSIGVLLSCFSQKDVMISYASNEVEISSASACLIDYASGEVLFEKNKDEKRPVASMVKMMTILLTLEDLENERISLDDKLVTSEKASGMGGSQVFIDPYAKYSIDDMLKSVIMASANDASVALAEYLNGSEEAFVKRMNKRAKELGMKNTNYVNCTGLPAPEQYSSAQDSAILLSNVTKHDVYHKYSTIWMDKLVHSGDRETELVNTNKLIRYYEGCDGGKTGSTNEAGCCLSATAKRGDMRLVSVIVGAENSKTRFNECSKLFNYGFANFENKKLIDCEIMLSEIPVAKGKKALVKLYAQEDFVALVKKGDASKWTYNIELPKTIKAPVKQGDCVGKILVLKNSQVVKEISIVSKESVEKISFIDGFKKIVENW